MSVLGKLETLKMFWVKVLHALKSQGGGSYLFFGGYVPRGFPKVGSSERVFFEK